MPSIPLPSSTLLIDVLAQALVPLSEHLVESLSGSGLPWWSFGLVKRTSVLIATDARIWLANFGASLAGNIALQELYQVPLPNVETCQVRLTLFTLQLVFAGQAESLLVGRRVFGTPGPVRCTLSLAARPLKVNDARALRARTIESLVETVRACASMVTAPLVPPLVAPLPQSSSRVVVARRGSPPYPTHDVGAFAPLTDSQIRR
jgi:hypothetical protein